MVGAVICGFYTKIKDRNQLGNSVGEDVEAKAGL